MIDVKEFNNWDEVFKYLAENLIKPVIQVQMSLLKHLH